MGFLYVGDVFRCSERVTRSRMHVVGYSLCILWVKLFMVYLSGLSVVWPTQSGVKVAGHSVCNNSEAV